MVLLQNKLNLRVSQKQILTPGLVQMVSVLALNKLELKEMINTEMVENPVLEELDSSVPLLDEVAGREEAHERQDAKDIKEKDDRALLERARDCRSAGPMHRRRDRATRCRAVDHCRASARRERHC